MTKSILTTIFFIGIFACSEAQVDPLYAQYLMNPLLINPAYSGLNKNLNVGISYRKQWAGVDGSPSTYNINAHTSLAENKMGVGLLVIKDDIGSNNNTEVQATYAYRVDLNEKYLSFGLQAGFLNFRNDNGKLNPYDPSDPVFSGKQNTTSPSVGAGLILNSERYFIGLSVPRMLKARDEIYNTSMVLYRQHFYAMAAYVVYLNNRVRFKPSVLLKGVRGAPISADVNLSMNLDEKYTAGLFTRNFKAYGILAQLKLGNGFRFGYIFEIPTNNTVGSRFTTHEFSLGVNLSTFSFHETGVTNF
jgi:type IX secretion system PorP/SprF family membrane protein